MHHNSLNDAYMNILLKDIFRRVKDHKKSIYKLVSAESEGGVNWSGDGLKLGRRIVEYLILLSLETNVPVKSKLQQPPPGYTPGILTRFPAREERDLMNLVYPGTGHLITTHRR